MIAAAMTGDGDAAFDYYKRINPSAREAIGDLHRCEPYVYAQMIAGRDAPTHGEAKNSWLTGTAAWNYVAITQWILGIRPELDGLRIDPVHPVRLAGLHRHPALPRRDLPDHRPPGGHARLRPRRGRGRARRRPADRRHPATARPGGRDGPGGGHPPRIAPSPAGPPRSPYPPGGAGAAPLAADAWFVPMAQDHRGESGVPGPSPRGGAGVTLSATPGEGGAR